MTLSQTLRKLLPAVFIGLLSALPATAQMLGTDEMPGRARAERFVKEATALPSADAVSTVVAAAKSSASLAKGESIVRTAMKYLGSRYRSGHSGPTAFDCSGFTSFVYKRESIALTRSSRTQYAEGRPIASIKDLRKGDLVFFGGSSRSRAVGHVGIVTEVDTDGKNFKFVHAARTGVQVDNSSTAYYSRRYIGARRIIED